MRCIAYGATRCTIRRFNAIGKSVVNDFGVQMTKLMTVCVLVVVVVASSVVIAPVFRYAITGVVVLCRMLGGM